MNRIESLVKAWSSHVATPWAGGLSGGEKVWFCVYDEADERRLRLHLPEFEGAAKKAGHGWDSLDLTDSFATWMAAEEYRDSYFEDPSDLTEAKLLDFRDGLVALISPRLETAGEADVVALTGVSSLFGFVRVSELASALEPSIRGRLVVFFPGEYENGNYRFLDARDGWSYRAVPDPRQRRSFRAMTMKNREVFQKDPLELRLVNNGVAKVGDDATAEELKTLHYELETFVCEKQYARGLQRILDGYLGALGKEEQKPVWVSGFFGSGKSHLVKMLRALWVDQELPGGARARGIAHLPNDLKASLEGARRPGQAPRRPPCRGRHARLGRRRQHPPRSPRRRLPLGRPPGELGPRPFRPLPEEARLVREGEEGSREGGKELEKELRNLYVSPVLAKALLKVDPNFAESEAKARLLLKEQFPSKDEISENDLIDTIHEALDVDGKLPLTLLVLDEVQQWIGEDPARSSQVNNLAECLAKRFGARVLLVATGQTALSGRPSSRRSRTASR